MIPRRTANKPASAKVSRLSQRTECEPATDEVSQVSLSQPESFPIDALPWRVQWLLLEAANALGVDPAMVAGPCLAALAGCIGNRRRIEVKPRSWYEPAILWIAVVMRSGGGKTPAINVALEHLQDREGPERLLVSDITTEGLLSVHAAAPLGLVLYRDELGAWFRSHNQYKQGQGADAQTWCEMHQGKPARVDRKTSPPLSVKRATVSIVGGVQPELLWNVLSGEHLYNGVAARFLFVLPREQVRTWTERTISDQAKAEFHSLCDKLLGLETDQEGNPIDLPMTAEAKISWIAYHDEQARRQKSEDGPLAASMSKLQAATARLALVLELADNPRATAVGVEAMNNAIALSNWFEGQARLVYARLEGHSLEENRRLATEWIATHGGQTTPRDFQREGPGSLRKRAQSVLDDLVSSGLVEKVPQTANRGAKYTLVATATVATGQEEAEA